MGLKSAWRKFITPIMYTEHFNNQYKAQRLIDTGSSPTAIAWEYITSEEMFDVASEYGIDVNHHISLTPHNSILMRACEENSPNAKKLVLAGADINYVNDNNQTALIKLFQNYSPIQEQQTQRGELFHFFLENGANPNLGHMPISIQHPIFYDTPTDNGTLLMYAITKNETDMAQKLMEYGADVNALSTSQKFSPLMYAAALSNETIMDALLQKNANVNQINSNGQTALTLAIQDANESTIKKLLDNKADVNVVSKSGETPLTYMAEHMYRYPDLFAQMAAQRNDSPNLSSEKKSEIDEMIQRFEAYYPGRIQQAKKENSTLHNTGTDITHITNTETNMENDVLKIQNQSAQMV